MNIYGRRIIRTPPQSPSGPLVCLPSFLTAMYLFRGVTSLFRRSPLAVVQPRFFSPSTSWHFFGLVGADRPSVGVDGVGLFHSWHRRWGHAYPPVAAVWQPGSLFPLLTFPLLAALGGWALACLLHTKPKLFYVARSNWAKTVYVLILNKFYLDEIYTITIVRPTIRFAEWLWRALDVRGIDRLIRGIATSAILLARWLWRVVDVRGIDRAVVGSARQTIELARWLWQIIDVQVIDRAVERTGSRSVGLARWLWEAIDVRRIEKSAVRIGHVANVSGHKLQDVEPRTLQHHLLVLISWLVVAITFFYAFVL